MEDAMSRALDCLLISELKLYCSRVTIIFCKIFKVTMHVITVCCDAWVIHEL